MCLCPQEFENLKESPSEGVYIYGLYLDGCAWSGRENKLVDSEPKKLYHPLPVLYVTGVQAKVCSTTIVSTALLPPNMTQDECPLLWTPAVLPITKTRTQRTAVLGCTGFCFELSGIWGGNFFLCRTRSVAASMRHPATVSRRARASTSSPPSACARRRTSPSGRCVGWRCCAASTEHPDSVVRICQHCCFCSCGL